MTELDEEIGHILTRISRIDTPRNTNIDRLAHIGKPAIPKLLDAIENGTGLYHERYLRDRQLLGIAAVLIKMNNRERIPGIIKMVLEAIRRADHDEVGNFDITPQLYYREILDLFISVKKELPELAEAIANENPKFKHARRAAFDILKRMATREDISEVMPELYRIAKNNYSIGPGSWTIKAIELIWSAMEVDDECIAKGIGHVFEKQRNVGKRLDQNSEKIDFESAREKTTREYLRAVEKIRNARVEAPIVDCELTRMAERMMEQRARSGNRKVFRQVRRAVA
ncbi:MAG: hypothetical protein WCT31_02190 [Candidatus Micrarchaeia archaeon]